MLFEIKHRFSGNVLFSLETKTLRLAVESGVKKMADLSGADLSGADLSGADLRGADLRWSDLSGANLRWSDLSGANLSGADLSGAKITDEIEISKTPIQISGAHWDITVWDSHIQIGCEFYSMAEWFAFSDKQINEMDRSALKFWRQWKEPIKAICIAENRYQEEEKAA